MKWLYIILGVVLGVPIILFGSVYAASELGGEVVVLHRVSHDGSVNPIRVWIVDDGGRTWIEHGAADSYWISMLGDDPGITLERNGMASTYDGIPDPDSHTKYHQLRREKYGFADQVVQVMGGSVETCEGIPVRVEIR